MQYVIFIVSIGFFVSGFAVGSHYDTSNWNPLEDPNFVNCTAQEEADLSSVGWGVQQENEASAIHEGFVTGMTTRSNDRFTNITSENRMPRNWHQKDYHYYLAGIGTGTYLSNMAEAGIFINSKTCSGVQAVIK